MKPENNNCFAVQADPGMSLMSHRRVQQEDEEWRCWRYPYSASPEIQNPFTKTFVSEGKGPCGS